MAFSKYLDPKNDIAFKKIFGTEKNKDILIHFLNDILGFSENSSIKDIEFLSPIQEPETSTHKQTIVDVLCKDTHGSRYIIEMQVAKSRGFEKRAQYYAAKSYVRQANVGDAYHDLKEIIFIAIADCEIFPDKSSYKSDHIILDKVTYKQDLKDFSFTFIELAKFNKNAKELSSIEDKWCYFFKHAHETKEEDLQRIIGKDTIIHKAYDALNQFHWTEKELTIYENMKRDERDYIAGMDQAEIRGLEKGKIEGEMQLAKRLLQSGLEFDVIVQSSALSEEQIESLKQYVLKNASAA